ncbi:probable glucosamine 6-phosphate N-acetyltransferase isoform X1 [Lingula anatina]|uniref:Glucosamine 6-phosphate N-acetyltransferase n=2 Tax=Lingula anatina TaxID=7574 RepID=A0A1S3JX09_LINAN|nr:probable glucosamine 6-phosphate N-acetyltransferase isoform X1 [Lingula anatina]XP_013414587.1 probable glucosamine 6-phosphate N-acetyltransferase isoform X1 [Lingula anatina]|eukprot:XP_013414586.1 probable glucosamine 6-phosphate N-acetyltransferase isoform X1 [Lingula anatina]
MENGAMEEVYLYEPKLLKEIDFSTVENKFKHGISPRNPGENLILRPLSSGDFDRGFLQLLTQLTSVGEVSRAMFEDQFNNMKACKNTYYVTVIEDKETNAVIGAASLVCEEKFIHATGKRGRVEDVVVSSDYRGKQLGKVLVAALTFLGKHVGCYKMSLECSDDMVPFYQQLGYIREQNYMQQRFKN